MSNTKNKPVSHTTDQRQIEAYTHDDKSRLNNPPAGLGAYENQDDSVKTYSFDPHADPSLDWAGKAEGVSFGVPTSSIHIHESVKPHKIIRSLMTAGEDLRGVQVSLFETDIERFQRRQDAIEFYRHGVDWTNRLIAGDSLVVMNSLIGKEGLGGQVQMVYFDPPYGIRYGSNFQPFVDQRDVQDRRDEDLTQEPEMIKAFRDTWELGVHSYLTYLRNRLFLARQLLAETGSLFLQISDVNLHHVREICDEIFGADNFVTQIMFQTTSGFESNTISRVGDYLCWYAKNKDYLKYHRLYTEQVIKPGYNFYNWLLLPDGTQRNITAEEKKGLKSIPPEAKIYISAPLKSQGGSSDPQLFTHKGKTYSSGNSHHWKTSLDGLQMLADKQRIHISPTNIRYRRFSTDFPYMQYTNIWSDTSSGGFSDEKIYVVQTSPKVVARCLLMTTDPGDLVLDITCGSGTTAFAAEQWGRRWITCDTSRVALTLAKKRLMTATYDYYRLADEPKGVAAGFVYKTVKRVTLRSVANNEPPPVETLYDRPQIDKTKIRVSGPFTVEALPAPVVKPLHDPDEVPERLDAAARLAEWRDELLATGIIGRGGARIGFSRVENMPGTRYLQAEAETTDSPPRKAVVCFAGETKPLDARLVALALDEAENLRPAPKIIVFAAFQFDPQAARMIDDAKWPGVVLLKAQMNTDMITGDLKKKLTSNQSYWLVGQPDVELVRLKDGPDQGKFQVKVSGYDYYNVKLGLVESGDEGRIAMWMLDTDYDGMCVEPRQVFFPLGGKNGGWAKLAKTLRTEINQELVGAYAGTTSLPFEMRDDQKIAVKIIDDRGLESFRVMTKDD